MECIQRCETAAANQSGFDAQIQALWTNKESFDRQASQLRLNRDDEDLQELVSNQLEDELIDAVRKTEDEDRITSRKRQYEQIVKKCKVEDEQIDTNRKAEDEDRITSRKRQYEQIVKKRKVEDEGHERSAASLLAEATKSKTQLSPFFNRMMTRYTGPCLIY
ncbi:hypothetical protein LTR41_002437 [Exophiala xenobiotica]|nr:hypothetical protein LTR41_002437 [Exophiala xenobiotica]